MRKCLAVSFVLLLLLFHTVGIAFAAEQQTAGVDIPVVIEGGGTAYMIPGVNCPMPEELTIRIDNGRTGHFYINFTEAGKFFYTIRAGFSEGGSERASDKIFRLTVTVYMRVDGTLYTVSIINGVHEASKSDEIRFEKESESSTEQTDVSNPPDMPSNPDVPTNPITHTNPGIPTFPETTTNPDTPTFPDTPNTPNTPGTPPDTPHNPGTPETPRIFRIFSAPKTGDESHLIRYILIAIASSAGLFCLALVYTMNTNKLIKKD